MIFYESSNAASIVEETSSTLQEDNLQGFANEEISKSEVLDMMCAMRSFENIHKET
jgi:hypothetical protein